MNIEEIKNEALWCLGCKAKPCSKACPMHTNIPEFIAKIKEEPFDYCYFSWEYLLDPTNRIIIEKEPPEWNQSIWNCVYSRKLIGSVRFDETKRTAEDAIFNMMVRKGEHAIIPKILYKYNTGREDNLSRLIESR